MTELQIIKAWAEQRIEYHLKKQGSYDFNKDVISELETLVAMISSVVDRENTYSIEEALEWLFAMSEKDEEIKLNQHNEE